MFSSRRLAIGNIGPLDFTLAAGECLSLSGPSGAGKTRLLRAMADLDAHAGTCYLDDRATADFDAPHWRRQVMFLPAEAAWWADTPRQHLPTTDAALATGLASLDLDTALLERPLNRLSSGQRQRLALLRLLAYRPRVLLLDEPTANLDPDNIARVEQLIGRYCREHGGCCVWVAHDHDQRARVAGQHIALDAGGHVNTKH